MREDTHENESGWTVCEGVSEERGKSIDPENLPDDAAPANPTAYREVPIGVPVSKEKYKKMKEAAKKGKPPSGAKGQVDPSA